MYKALAAQCGLIFLVCTAYGQDSHQMKTDAITRKYVQEARGVAEAANKIDLDLQKYGHKSKYTEQARLVARNLFHTAAWKDVTSRETKKHRAAVTAINQMIELANSHLSSGRQELASLEQAAYAEWAKTHPDEARLMDMQRRLEAAEEAAKIAATKAQEAEESAERARRDAQRRPEYINVMPPPPREPGRVTIDMRPEKDKDKDDDGDKPDEPDKPIRPPKEPPSRRVTISGKSNGPSGASQ